MKLYKTVRLPKAVRDIRLEGRLAPQEVAERREKSEKAAYERGRQDGERALSEQLLHQRAELLELHQGVVASLRAAVPRIVRETQAAMVELAIEAARKIVAGLPIDASLVEAVVREAVSHAEDNSNLTVELNPEDLALLRKHQSPILESGADSPSLKFLGSSEVSRGGCVVQTRFGLLDARRERKIEQLRQAIPA